MDQRFYDELMISAIGFAFVEPCRLEILRNEMIALLKRQMKLHIQRPMRNDGSGAVLQYNSLFVCWQAVIVDASKKELLTTISFHDSILT